MDGPKALWIAAVDKAYRVFSEYPAPVSLDAAPKHNVVEVMRQLRSSPLHQLTADCLGAFAGSALYTIGATQDYKHFLPRILELSGTNTAWMGLESPIIARKLIYAEWTQWPQTEQAAIRQVFEAGWFAARDAALEAYDANSWLCANAYLRDDPIKILADWLPIRNDVSALQLASFIAHTQGDLSEAPYWDEVPADRRQAVEMWMMRSDVHDALRYAEKTVPADQSWLVSEALKYIRRH